MPGSGGNIKSFERPKDLGDKFAGLHDNKKEGREVDYRLMGGYVKEPIEAAGSQAKKAGAKKGSGAQSARKGPEHSRTKGKVSGRKR